MSEEEATASVTDALLRGKRPEDGCIIAEESELVRAKDAYEVLQNATPEDVDALVEKTEPITVKTLQEQAQKRAENLTSSKKKAENTEEEKRTAVYEEIAVSLSIEVTEVTQITARRQLEEARLAMSVQANFRLIRQGISIETRPLAQLVEDLKEAEKSFCKEMFEQNGVAFDDASFDLMSQTREMVEDLKSAPAETLGMQISSQLSIRVLYESSQTMRLQMEASARTYETLVSEAGRSESMYAEATGRYETMMTAPRADLGDSMQKAFRNVDDILEDLQLEKSAQNERAVRILAYNETEITRDSVAEIRVADSRVQALLKNLTPATTMHLIKNGINPIETEITKLTGEIEKIREENSYADDEDYAEFLWKMEHTEGIEDRDRQAYIGMYRLIHQIEKSDGAVIGALVKQGAELSLKNLLTSVKTRQRASVSADVDDDFGVTESVSFEGSTIASQLAAGFGGARQRSAEPEMIRNLLQQNGQSAAQGESFFNEMSYDAYDAYMEAAERETYDAKEAYLEAQTARMAECVDAEESVMRLLADHGVVTSVNMVYAAQDYFEKRNRLYQQVFGITFGEEEDTFAAAKQTILERMAEDMSSPKEMAEAQEALAEIAENVLRNMLPPADKVTSLDVRELRMMQNELQLHTSLARSEKYAIPVMIEDETATVHLEIVRGTREKGKVEITLETELYGRIAAELSDLGSRVEGLIVGSDPQAADFLESIARTFTAEISTEEKQAEIHVAQEPELDLTQFETVGGRGSAETDPSSEAYRAQTSSLYAMAKAFIASVIRTGRNQ